MGTRGTFLGPGGGVEHAGRLAREASLQARAQQLAPQSPVQAPAAPPRRNEVAGRTGTVVPRPAAEIAGQVDGARWLNVADMWLGRYCRYPDEESRHAMTLSTAVTHFRSADEKRRNVFPALGRVMIVAQKGTGKTTAMKTAGYLCQPFFFGIDGNPTAPGLCMTIGQEHAVVFIDEAHRLFGPRGSRKADVVTVLNNGYDVDGTYLNGRGGKATRVHVFAPVFIAGRDELLGSASEELDDLIDRSICLSRFTGVPDDGAEPPLPVTETTRAQGAQIAQALASWAAQEMAGDRFDPALEAAWEAAEAAGMRRGTRGAQIWHPLFTVAALASQAHLEAAIRTAHVLHGRRPAADAGERLAALEAELGVDSAATW